MPELPEVETLRRRLQEVLPGKTIVQVTQHHPKSLQADLAWLYDQTIKEVKRKAKILQFDLGPDKNLLTHLKMTGQLIFIDSNQNRVGGGHPTADWVQNLPAKHTRITYSFDDGSQLFFNDQRLFGWMKAMTDAEVDQEFSKYAHDIDQPEVTLEYLYPLLQRRRSAIKVVLLDPKVVSGLGNIYVCDALNLAQISPFRPANSLSQAEAGRLLEASKRVIQLGVENNGTTFDGSYVNIDGLAGGYQNLALVYAREGETCKNCGGTIQKEKLAGRGTYYCPNCQL